MKIIRISGFRFSMNLCLFESIWNTTDIKKIFDKIGLIIGKKINESKRYIIRSKFMLGAIIGDIVGSCFEWNNCRSKEFELFNNKCFPTDDSIMTLAVAQAIVESKEDYSARL